MQSSVNDVQNLPNQCKNGYIVKISNSRMADEDDYYVNLMVEKNRDGSGSWSECAKGGIAKTLTNMPLLYNVQLRLHLLSNSLHIKIEELVMIY